MISMIHLAPKLSYSNLDEVVVLKHFVRMARDEQGGIRTNTIVCLGKIARHLHPKTRQQALLACFSRGLKDPFPPTQPHLPIMKLALALATVAPAAAFFGGGGAPAASRVVDTTADIGVDPGPITPSGFFFEEKESLARRRAVEVKHGRIAMIAFIGMIVEELGVTFPGSMTLDGSVQFSDILKDGMGFPAIDNIPKFGLFQIVAFAFIAETAALPAGQYTGGPQNLPGGYDGSAGTIPGGYPFTTQIEDVEARNRALTCELQNGRAAMLGTLGAMIHSELDSCQHHFFYPITHN